jgi:hypothetical protein
MLPEMGPYDYVPSSILLLRPCSPLRRRRLHRQQPQARGHGRNSTSHTPSPKPLRQPPITGCPRSLALGDRGTTKASTTLLLLLSHIPTQTLVISTEAEWLHHSACAVERPAAALVVACFPHHEPCFPTAPPSNPTPHPSPESSPATSPHHPPATAAPPPSGPDSPYPSKAPSAPHPPAP